MAINSAKMPFLEHATEMRRRLIFSLSSVVVAGIFCYLIYEPVLALLLRPLSFIADSNSDAMVDTVGETYLYINTIFEGFLVRVKVSLIAGAIVSLPVHICNLMSFIFPGLTRIEKRAVFATIAASFVLLLLGFFYSYYSVIPLSVQFLVSAGFIPTGVGLLLNFQRNVFFVFQFLVIFLIVFQTPILLIILMMTGIVTRKQLLRISRYAVVFIFALSAVVTPPDVVSQISLAIPMIGMFFLSILVAKILKLGVE